MKITQDVREYAAQKEIDEHAALVVGGRRRRKSLWLVVGHSGYLECAGRAKRRRRFG